MCSFWKACLEFQATFFTNFSFLPSVISTLLCLPLGLLCAYIIIIIIIIIIKLSKFIKIFQRKFVFL
jgi:hypothetical protein